MVKRAAIVVNIIAEVPDSLSVDEAHALCEVHLQDAVYSIKTSTGESYLKLEVEALRWIQ